METEKSCYNCRYFYQHYVITSIGIRPIDCGHCSKRKIKAKELNKFPFKTGCELWEENTVKNKERKVRFTKKLNEMAREIHDIALILKEDERKSSE